MRNYIWEKELNYILVQASDGDTRVVFVVDLMDVFVEIGLVKHVVGAKEKEIL